METCDSQSERTSRSHRTCPDARGSSGPSDIGPSMPPPTKPRASGSDQWTMVGDFALRQHGSTGLQGRVPDEPSRSRRHFLPNHGRSCAGACRCLGEQRWSPPILDETCMSRAHDRSESPRPSWSCGCRRFRSHLGTWATISAAHNRQASVSPFLTNMETRKGNREFFR